MAAKYRVEYSEYLSKGKISKHSLKKSSGDLMLYTVSTKRSDHEKRGWLSSRRK